MAPTPAVRVRFCPAPSGWLHVGGARTALFNWLWARKHDGVFLLRIEDTDAERATVASAHGMMAALQWLGLQWDEGPMVADAPYGPYLQSERRPLHDAVARRLLAAGAAYETTETEEGRRPALRVRTPDAGTIRFDDAVRGAVSFDWKDLGDFVIARADGSPTYLLANVVDDLAQGIGFVARGEDLLAATPRQLLMQELLGPTGILDDALEEVGYAPRPPGSPDMLSYAHLPLLIGEDRKKLSKRHGDVAVDAFERAGFLPEVMVNFLALCGWSYDGQRERFTVSELVEAFSFDRVQPSPAFFDTAKLRALNGDAIRELSDAELADRLVPVFQREGLVRRPEDERLVRGFAPLVKERSPTLAEAIPFVAFAFRDSVDWDEQAVAKWLKPEAGAVLDHLTPRLEALEEWTADALLALFTDAGAGLGLGLGKVMQPVRVVVTGSAVSPPLPETLAVLDQAWVAERVRAGRARVADG